MFLVNDTKVTDSFHSGYEILPAVPVLLTAWGRQTQNQKNTRKETPFDCCALALLTNSLLLIRWELKFCMKQTSLKSLHSDACFKHIWHCDSSQQMLRDSSSVAPQKGCEADRGLREGGNGGGKAEDFSLTWYSFYECTKGQLVHNQSLHQESGVMLILFIAVIIVILLFAVYDQLKIILHTKRVKLYLQFLISSFLFNNNNKWIKKKQEKGCKMNRLFVRVSCAVKYILL